MCNGRMCRLLSQSLFVVVHLLLFSMSGCGDDDATNPTATWTGTGALKLVRIHEEWNSVTSLGEPPEQGYYTRQVDQPLDYLVVGSDSVVQHHFYGDCYERGSFPFALDGSSITSLHSDSDSLEVTVYFEPVANEVAFRITYRDYSTEFPGLRQTTYTYVPCDDAVPPAEWLGQECAGNNYEPWGDYL